MGENQKYLLATGIGKNVYSRMIREMGSVLGLLHWESFIGKLTIAFNMNQVAYVNKPDI